MTSMLQWMAGHPPPPNLIDSMLLWMHSHTPPTLNLMDRDRPEHDQMPICWLFSWCPCCYLGCFCEGPFGG